MLLPATVLFLSLFFHSFFKGLVLPFQLVSSKYLAVLPNQINWFEGHTRWHQVIPVITRKLSVCPCTGGFPMSVALWHILFHIFYGALSCVQYCSMSFFLPAIVPVQLYDRPLMRLPNYVSNTFSMTVTGI